MPFSASLADRIRRQLAARRGTVERRMFGGLGFLLHGHMLVGIWHDALIVRLGPEQAPAALAEPHVRPFDVTGRPMRGWVMVDAEGLDSDAELAGWIDCAWQFVVTLEPK